MENAAETPWHGLKQTRLSRRSALGRLSYVALGGIGLNAVALAACGRGNRLQGQPAAQRSGGQGQPKPGGQLHVRVTTDPFDFDVSYVGKATPNGGAMRLAYNSLLGFKAGPGIDYSDLQIEPQLAQSWEVNADATVFTFHLRRGVKFANLAPVNGRELTSADVKWSYEYLSRTGQLKDAKLPKSQFDWFFEGMSAIEAPDPYTVVVRFQKPFVPFLDYAAADFNPIVPHEIYDQDGNFKTHIAGSGPFQLDPSASQKGSRWVWKKNPAYWETGKPYIDEVDWLVVPDGSAATAALQSKQLDILGGNGVNISVAQGEQVKRLDPTVVVYPVDFPEPYHVWLNTRKHPLDDVRVRKAISLSVDRDGFLKAIQGGKGKWALAGALPDVFSQDEVHQLLKYDPAQAKQMLADAGYPNGVEIEFTYFAYDDTFVSVVQLFQAQLKQSGIQLNLKSLDKPTESTRRKAGDYFINITPGLSLEGDIDSYLFQFFHSSSKANYSGLTDPKLDSLIEAQRREPDASKRKQVIRQAIQYINVDVVDGLGLYYPQYDYFWQPSVKNYAPSWGTFGWPLTNAWLER